VGVEVSVGEIKVSDDVADPSVLVAEADEGTFALATAPSCLTPNPTLELSRSKTE